ncbi:MAG: peptide ABC transporter substrate-binding protein [Pseudomonadota bacterium]
MLALAVPGLAVPGLASGEERGRDGQVNIFFWQAPSILNTYLTAGSKDIEPASVVLEPLARFDDSGVITPWLARDIPTRENGGISADLKSVTWNLRAGLLWSDGSPVTSEDIRFTWQYCTADGGGCAQLERFDGITEIETPDPLTAILRFDAPKAYPYKAFVGAGSPLLQTAQFADCLGPRAPTCTEANFAPIGTGPFMVEDFRPGDVALFAANPNYRERDKPAFSHMLVKGGGTAETAARAVLETGEFDYAWNLQLAPEVLTRMEARQRGVVITGFSSLVEQIFLNLSNPATDLGDQRATPDNPHPALSDLAVRQALSLALDRVLLVELGYGDTGRVACNAVPAPAAFRSDANEGCRLQDVAGAKALLEAAGWVDSDGDGIRERNGIKLEFLFQTSVNAVRQNFQNVMKQWWQAIGVATELRAIEPSVFFGGDPGSDDTVQKFFVDIQMFATIFDGTDPEAYLAGWRCDRMPTPDNLWQGSNYTRFCDPAYDALSDQLSITAEPEARAALAREMNDLLVQSYVTLPLVERGRVSAHARTLKGVRLNTWDAELWNIADWSRGAIE